MLGSLRAYRDLCPHRGAALSQGVLRHGTLTCRAHGWRFNDAGQCQDVPSEVQFRPALTPCLTGLPVHEADGLVWLQPLPAVAATPPPLPNTPGLQNRQCKSLVLHGRLRGHTALLLDHLLGRPHGALHAQPAIFRRGRGFASLDTPHHRGGLRARRYFVPSVAEDEWRVGAHTLYRSVFLTPTWYPEHRATVVLRYPRPWPAWYAALRLWPAAFYHLWTTRRQTARLTRNLALHQDLCRFLSGDGERFLEHIVDTWQATPPADGAAALGVAEAVEAVL